MKIGVLIDQINVGGVEKVAIEEVRALIAVGHDASLVVMREKAAVKDSFPDLLRGLPVEFLDRKLAAPFRFSFGILFFHFFSFFHLSYPFLLPFVVKHHQYDYIIAHGTYTTLTALALKKRREIQFSAFIWDPASYIMERVYSKQLPRALFLPLHALAVGFDRFIIRGMNSVLVGGPAHNDFIRKQCRGVDISIIYPSVHPAVKIRPKKDYVLVVTAWKKGKNPEYLTEVVKSIPSIKIKMAGRWIDPSYKEYFQDYLVQQGCEKNVQILGGVSEIELIQLYSEARVLLQTNDDRGFGMPAMEAAAQGSTFIIPEGQGVCELYANNIDGYYTKECDTTTITAHLNNLLNDKEKATSMGKQAWAKTSKNYSWNIHAQGLIEVAKKYSSIH